MVYFVSHWRGICRWSGTFHRAAGFWWFIPSLLLRRYVPWFSCLATQLEMHRGAWSHGNPLPCRHHKAFVQAAESQVNSKAQQAFLPVEKSYDCPAASGALHFSIVENLLSAPSLWLDASGGNRPCPSRIQGSHAQASWRTETYRQFRGGHIPDYRFCQPGESTGYRILWKRIKIWEYLSFPNPRNTRGFIIILKRPFKDRGTRPTGLSILSWNHIWENVRLRL